MYLVSVKVCVTSACLYVMWCVCVWCVRWGFSLSMRVGRVYCVSLESISRVLVRKRVNAGSLCSHLISYFNVLLRSLMAWGKNLFRVLLGPDLVHWYSCRALAERTVCGLGGWSLSHFFVPSSDTTWYRYLIPGGVSCHFKLWCNQSRCSRWCSCKTFWGSEGPCQIFSASWALLWRLTTVFVC